MTEETRSFDPARDASAVARIWNEIRWIDDDDAHRRGLEAFMADGETEVGLMNGEAECMVHRTPGQIIYDRAGLPLCAISAVMTSHLGRRRGLASRLTARALRDGAESGAVVAALGMFEQGFYDRFGFGTGTAETWVTFNPASLKVDHVPYRTPLRLSAADSADVSRCMQRRLPHHCVVMLDAPHIFEAEMAWLENPFALGYRDGNRLAHFVAGSLKEAHGPFDISMMSYETGSELLELLRLLRELGDQIHSVRMKEPPEVQLQSLIEMPMRQRSRSISARHESGARSSAWWQIRILDVAAVATARHWHGDPIEFDLLVSDPIGDHLDSDGGWHGVAGTYAVHLGQTTSAVRSEFSGQPILHCSINAFSRLWFGIQPATSLSLMREIDAPDILCRQLDEALRLPLPHVSMSF